MLETLFNFEIVFNNDKKQHLLSLKHAQKSLLENYTETPDKMSGITAASTFILSYFLVLLPLQLNTRAEN